MEHRTVSLKDAIIAGKERNYQKAIDILFQVIHTDDNNHEAYLYLGRSYYALGKYALSIQFLRIFLEYDADSPTGHFFIGRSYLASGLIKKSIPHFKHSLKKHPESVHARTFLSIALMKFGRFERALTYLGEAVELSTGNERIFNMYLHCLLIVALRKFNSGDIDMAKQMFIFYTGYISDKVLPFIYLGMIERQEGNDKGALSYYEKAIELSPDDELLLFRRAVLLYKTGQREYALGQLNRLDIGIKSALTSLEDINENRFLALKYFQQKNYKEALFFGRESLKENYSDSDIHLMMGEAFRHLKNNSYAENHYKKAIEIDKSRVEFRYGYSLFLWNTGKYRELINELSKISDLDPDNSVCSYYTALASCKLDFESVKTIPALRELIHYHPSDPVLFKFLGEEYLKTGLLDLAERWFLKVELLSGGSSDLYSDFISIYRKNGDIAKLLQAMKNYLNSGSFDYNLALEYLQLLYDNKHYKETILEAEVILGYQKNLKVSRILANSYRMTGQYNKAQIIYRFLLKENPQNTVFLKALLYCMDKTKLINESILLCEQALKYLKKPESSLFLILGVLLHKNGETEKAQQIFRENITRFPDDWRSYYNLGRIYKEIGLDDFAERFLSESLKRKQKK